MTLQKKIFVFLIISLLLTAGKTFGQNETFSLSDYQVLDSIVIQNSRIQIPFSEQNRDIQILHREAIRSMPVQSVDELLSYVGGIDVRRRGEMGAQADISINGGTFDQTLLLIDGMKIIDPQTGHLLMNIPVGLESVERIEILKGPAAAAYGINAIHGAINIVTRQPDETGLSAHVQTGSSLRKDADDGKLYAGVAAGAAASLKTDRSRHFLSIDGVHSSGHYYNTAVDYQKIFYKNRIDLGDHSLEAMGGYVHNDFGANGFYSAPVDTESNEITETALASVRGKIRVNDFWTFRPSVSYRYGHDNYILDRYHPEIYENNHYTNVFDAGLNNTFQTRAGDLGFGVEYRNNDITSNSLGSHTRNDVGVFGNYSFDRIPRLSVNLGLYANYNDEFGWDAMPSVDAGYAVTGDLRIFANAGTGMRVPTFTDMYYTGPVNIGNPALKPEKSKQIGVGAKYHRSNLRFSAEYFFRKTVDFIDWVKDELEDPWTTLNYQNVEMQGISTDVQYTILQPSGPSGWGLSFHGSYTYLDPALKKSYDQNRFSNYALENLRHQLTGSFRFSLGSRYQLVLTERYEKRINYKDYLLLAARLSGTFGDFEVFADGDNLANVQVIEAGATPMAGRWFTLGVRARWQK